jgi:thioredoxin 1
LALLCFGARWAPPWVLLQPALDRLAAAGADIRRVDLDLDPVAAEQHRIITVPTLIVLRGTVERRRILGAVSEAELHDLLGVRSAVGVPRPGRERQPAASTP